MIHGQTWADGVCHTNSPGTKPMTDWIAIIQNMITTTLSVRVSAFTKITEVAKPSAAQSAISWPGLIVPLNGRTMMATPTKPRTTARFFHRPMRSPRKTTAKIAVQIGMVNSIEITCAIGMSVSAISQLNCAP
jgi:hypothetical protein